jgi:hypothetical protein
VPRACVGGLWATVGKFSPMLPASVTAQQRRRSVAPQAKVRVSASSVKDDAALICYVLISHDSISPTNSSSI